MFLFIFNSAFSNCSGKHVASIISPSAHCLRIRLRVLIKKTRIYFPLGVGAHVSTLSQALFVSHFFRNQKVSPDQIVAVGKQESIKRGDVNSAVEFKTRANYRPGVVRRLKSSLKLCPLNLSTAAASPATTAGTKLTERVAPRPGEEKGQFGIIFAAC